MRLIRSPFTKTGEVKYLELLKIVVFVMSIITSFSFYSNQIEIGSTEIASKLIAIVYVLFVFFAVYEVSVGLKEVLLQLKSFVLPYIEYGSETVMYVFEVLTISVVGFVNKIKPRSHCSRLCVMRC